MSSRPRSSSAAAGGSASTSTKKAKQPDPWLVDALAKKSSSRRRTRGRAASVSAPARYQDSPKPAAAALQARSKMTRQQTASAAATSTTSRSSKKKKPAATSTSSSSKKKAHPPSPQKKKPRRLGEVGSDGRLLSNGLYALIIDGEEVVRDAATAKRIAAKQARAAADGDASSSDTDSESAAAAAKVLPLSLAARAFDLDTLPERLDADVARMTAMNAAEIPRELQQKINEMEARKQQPTGTEAQQQQHSPAGDQLMESAAAAAGDTVVDVDPEDAAPSQEESDTDEHQVGPVSPPLNTSRTGRVRQKPRDPGAPLANYWNGGKETTSSKSQVKRHSWNSKEYKMKKQQEQQQQQRLRDQQQQQQQLTNQPTDAAAASSSSAHDRSAASSSDPALPSSSSVCSIPSASASPLVRLRYLDREHLQPLAPDRAANEIFQIAPAWRMMWADFAQRMEYRLSHLPLTEFDRFEGFELPFDSFGDAMRRYQARDVPPRFQLITRNRLAISKEYFMQAMGLKAKRKSSQAGGGGGGAGGGDDDEERCTCQYRDPALAPKPGSKQARDDQAAGRSFNCGDDCHNALLFFECTPANCNLTAMGRGDACANRRFTTGGWFPGVEPFKTEFKGWGIRCPASEIPAGAMVFEYVGEIINNQMCQERMARENERIRRMNETEMKRREEIRQREEKLRREREKEDEKRRRDREKEAEKERHRVSKLNPNLEHAAASTAGPAAGVQSSSRGRAVIPPRKLLGGGGREAEAETSRRRHPSSSSSFPSTTGKGNRSRSTGHHDGSGVAGGSSRSRIRYDTVASPTDDEEDPPEYMEGEGPKSANFYFLTLDSDIIIDAGARGGIARFTNHSCAPNCSIQKWNVDGAVRIGIFANQRIPPGKELTIDYKYDRVGNVHRQACFCGEKNCARFIGGKKREVAGDEPLSNKTGGVSRKSREPSKLSHEDADECCCICGDGGDMLMCDGRVCGRFCTRVYHPKCVGLKAAEIPARWICPYHFCDECGSIQPRYFCATCSQSACRKCWQASRLPDAKHLARQRAAATNDPPSTLHESRVRRDLALPAASVWTCCADCQLDPMAMRARERKDFYHAQSVQATAAILERRRLQPGFGGTTQPYDLWLAMFEKTFAPDFVCTYWNISQGLPGHWDDGWTPNQHGARPTAAEATNSAGALALRGGGGGGEGEEDDRAEVDAKWQLTDDEWEQRERQARLAGERDDEGDDEAEDAEGDEHPESEHSPPTSAVVAPSPCESTPMEIDEPDSIAPAAATPAASAAAQTKSRSKAKPSSSGAAAAAATESPPTPTPAAASAAPRSNRAAGRSQQQAASVAPLVESTPARRAAHRQPSPVSRVDQQVTSEAVPKDQPKAAAYARRPIVHIAAPTATKVTPRAPAPAAPTAAAGTRKRGRSPSLDQQPPTYAQSVHHATVHPSRPSTASAAAAAAAAGATPRSPSAIVATVFKSKKRRASPSPPRRSPSPTIGDTRKRRNVKASSSSSATSASAGRPAALSSRRQAAAAAVVPSSSASDLTDTESIEERTSPAVPIQEEAAANLASSKRPKRQSAGGAARARLEQLPSSQKVKIQLALSAHGDPPKQAAARARWFDQLAHSIGDGLAAMVAAITPP